jgi:hypothetical protein
MILYEHAAVRCPVCGRALYYGVKQEPTAWKVYYECHPESGCSYGTTAGRVSIEEIGSIDGVYERAEEMGRRL